MKTRTLNLILVTVLLLGPTPLSGLGTPSADLEAANSPTGSAAPVPAWVQREGPSSPPPAKLWGDLPPEVQAKVDPRILAELRGEILPVHLGGSPEQADVAPAEHKPLEQTRFLVYLKAKADLGTIARQRFATQAERRAAVFHALVGTAQATQGPIKALLDARASQGDVASYQPFYIFNGFAVEGSLDTVIELARRDDVERIAANYPLVPLWSSGKAASSPADGLGGLHPGNWNIDLVDAERVWDEFGVTGEDAVVAGIDTGVEWEHSALRSRYRGYNEGGPGVHLHDYNWFDPDSTLRAGGDLGPSRSGAPYDLGEHGTHTMGTMVGDGGTRGSQVGMAPGARWIAISLNQLFVAGSMADDIMGHKAFQWMLCPTDLTGALATADCSKAPDVVNNSWGSANPADDTFRPAIQALRAAGIAPVFAAGNPSAGAGSIGAPANAPEAITVGATDVDDIVAPFSGRGPSFYEGEQKPELSAPGVDVNSTLPGGAYSGPTWSGTSMAAPHVAGLVALMVSADLQDGYRDFDVDDLERFMAYTAVDLGDPGPDDDYGYGRIDAYNAVRWVRAAGDLRGTVRDAGTGAPIAGAAVTGVKAGPGDAFTARTGAGGQYSTTVPAGTYDVAVGAWGYTNGTFSGQTVITGALSIADFSLTPMPTAALTGEVRDGVTPVSGARVYVVANPSVNCTTGPGGAYTLSLPVGAHEIAVEAAGYRILRESVSVASGGSTHSFSMTPAPTILLVDADTYAGWFGGWPVHNFFQWALDRENYLYDLWMVQYHGFNDTRVMPDGSIGYGIPSPPTLGAYDLVIWAHGAGNWGPTGSTVDMGAADELMAYLDSGGRLILSGQDVGWSDDGTTFYDDYLHADCVVDTAGGEGATVSGSEFLNGLHLEITNASLHGYANGATELSPDAVALVDGAAFAVLTYDNGNGSAALAVDPCDATVRAVYFALGYENIAPRAGNRDPAIAEVLDRSIAWVTGGKPAYGVSVSAVPSRAMAEPGGTVTYDLRVSNRGSVAATFELSLAGNTWPTRILSGTAEVNMTQALLPCEWQVLTLEVDVPDATDVGDRDTVTVTASRHPAGTPSASASVTTAAFPLWQVETPMPTPRYRLAAAHLPGDAYYYAIGGQGGEWWGEPMSANERYNACTGEWEIRAPMPTARGNTGAAAIDGKIYVPGGSTEGLHVDVLEIYDPATDSWSSGAPVPEALSCVAVAAYGGRLYVFGGVRTDGGDSAGTYAYDPVTETWAEKAPMPGGGRACAAAAQLNGKIYVVGGWPNLRTVERYDPATDTWSTVAPMNVGRQSPGLTAAPDGYLYVSDGGDTWTGLNSAERYDPATDTWESIPSLNDPSRAGSASAYAAGHVFAVGGVDPDLSDVNESLRLHGTFCDSDKSVLQSVVQPGGRISYTVEIHSDPVDLTGASVDLTGASLVDPIPAGTTFAGFGVNPIGATYNRTDDRVEWNGAIPAGADPMAFTFAVDVATGGLKSGDRITNAATFDSGTGLVFTRAVDSVLSFPDVSPSVKSVDKREALAGDLLTYTIRVENGSAISDVFTLRDPIPAHATYVPGSLTCTLGTASYDPADQTITWTGTLPGVGVYVNTSGDYEWGDSDGNGSVSGVVFEWVDATGGSVAIDSYVDDGHAGPFDVGFTFNYYGTDYTQFYVSSNGSVQFGDGYGGYDWCPIGSDPPNNAIHLLGGDRVVDGAPGRVYYQTLGVAPNRYTVIEFYQLRNFGGSAPSNLEVILHENGAIALQYWDMAAEMTSGVIGIDDDTGAQAVEYLDTCPAAVHDDLAVLFLPDGVSWVGLTRRADVTFAVSTPSPLPVNTWITNTATIAGPSGAVERSAGTLINPVDLSSSSKVADRARAGVGDLVRYAFVIQRTGLLTAAGATLIDPIPATMAYEPGSLTYTLGTGGYDPVSKVITWTGTLPGLVGYAPAGYEWGDSDANGTVPGVTFDWIDIRATGTNAGSGDESYHCGLPIGFTFSFYGTDEATFCASTNGFVSFDTSGGSDYTSDCPLPSSFDNAALIAGIWDDLVTEGGIYYQAFGMAPNRYLVVQWADVRHYGGSVTFDFEVVLHEDGSIEVQMLDAGPELGSGSTTGLEDYTETHGLTYACDTAGSIHDNLAVLFRPIAIPLYSDSADISFAARLSTALPDRTPVTNTALLDNGHGDIYDLEAVFLAGGSDLSASYKQVVPGEVEPGDTLTYTVYVRNAGGGATVGEMRDELPPGLSYETGSLLCGTGSCGYASGVVTWTGMLDSRGMVPVRFRATVLGGAGHGGMITNTAIVTDVSWGVGYPAVASVRSIGSDIYYMYMYMPLVLRGR